MEKNTKEKLAKVDYCKEAMEMHLSKLSPKDIEKLTYNLAVLLKGKIETLDIALNRIDDKTNKPYKVLVPAVSFLRTDAIKKSLNAVGISESEIQKYIDKVTPAKADLKEKSTQISVNEVKRFIYDSLKEKYGDAVITSKYEKDIVINASKDKNGNNICIKLELK